MDQARPTRQECSTLQDTPTWQRLMQLPHLQTTHKKMNSLEEQKNGTLTHNYRHSRGATLTQNPHGRRPQLTHHRARPIPECAPRNGEKANDRTRALPTNNHQLPNQTPGQMDPTHNPPETTRNKKDTPKAIHCSCNSDTHPDQDTYPTTFSQATTKKN